MKVCFEQSARLKYYVTSHGKVFSVDREGNEIEKKLTVHKRGYVYVRTPKKNYQLHRLVASAFIDNKYNKPTVNHKDGNKQNNNIDNLEWATYKENAQHAIKNGFTKQMKKNEGNIKYTNEQCKQVMDKIKLGMTYIKAGSIYGMPYSTVAHLMRGSRRSV